MVAFVEAGSISSAVRHQWRLPGDAPSRWSRLSIGPQTQSGSNFRYGVNLALTVSKAVVSSHVFSSSYFDSSSLRRSSPTGCFNISLHWCNSSNSLQPPQVCWTHDVVPPTDRFRSGAADFHGDLSGDAGGSERITASLHFLAGAKLLSMKAGPITLVDLRHHSRP